MSINLLGVTENLPDHLKEYTDAFEMGVSGFHEIYSIFQDPGFDSRRGWKKEAEDQSGAVHSLNTRHGKLYCAKFEVDVDLETLMDDNWHGVEQMAEWNTHVEFCKILVRITENINIVHYGNGPVLMVSGRDFVSMRIKREVDGVIYTSGCSVDAPGIPKPGDRVRAIIKLGGGKFRSHPQDKDKSIVEIMHCIDFKGMVPKSVIHQVMGKMMLKDIEEHQKHAADLKKKKNESK
ncbi:unnamed protein product [Bursaphelenchus xylophilus]|uniref:(pine wood nematode) hypothetical protein n=1 Tax=Bursaphelenchus xylophilus TaxID=6326 RepID=A0A1I7SAE2_BURXY|nr:unnamed protein product [Bursaphelenchus xylophilus]CAG9084006.1 unnamed protein product [Bursaphelenchus xylophilus]